MLVVFFSYLENLVEGEFELDGRGGGAKATIKVFILYKSAMNRPTPYKTTKEVVKMV